MIFRDAVLGAVLFASIVGSAERIPAVRTVPHELDVLVKTGHIQGAACCEEGVFLSHMGGVEMIGWDGKLIRRVDAPSHLGDIACYEGKIYGTFGLRGDALGSQPDKPGMIRVWNMKLELLKEKRFTEHFDGIVVLNGTIYTGVSCWAKGVKHSDCIVKRLDLELNDLGNTTIDLGYPIKYGVQTMATDGKDLFFGNYGGSSKVSPDLKIHQKVDYRCSEGFALVPKSISRRETPVFFRVHALGGNMQGWRKDPTNNPPRVELLFSEYKDGKFIGITEMLWTKSDKEAR